MDEITITYHPQGSYTIIGNPKDEEYWEAIKSCEMFKLDFQNDQNQIDEWVKEMKEDIMESWKSDSLTMTLIGIDEPSNVIVDIARKYRSRGHTIGVWNWTHDYYVISHLNEDLKIPSIKVGEDGFGRFGNHAVADV